MGSRMRCLSPSCAMWRAVGFVCLLSSLTLYLAVAGERFRTSSDKLQCSALRSTFRHQLCQAGCLTCHCCALPVLPVHLGFACIAAGPTALFYSS